MAKDKKGKKGKKKGGKKKKEEIDPNLLTEVDKTFYELQITDLNRKLARLRSLTAELEQKNEDLTQELQKIDEERSDIIVYLKRMLQEKSDEIKEVQDRLQALEETRLNETEEYENKIVELEAEYKQLHEQLTSEIKLLEGKLNALEEFRVQRDELMRKYEQQEVQMDEQEKRHKRELYETEKKFIMGKDKLKKEMEARLLQLSTEFHDATELRIASTTHRVIRENIAINNELEIMLGTHKRLYSENMAMKERDRTLRQKTELFESEARGALQRSDIQNRIIERLTQKNELLEKQMCNYKALQKQFSTLLKQNEQFERENKMTLQKMLVVEQNLHQSRVERASLQQELLKIKDENASYVDVIYEAVNAIKACMFVGSVSSEESLRTVSRESLLNNLLNLMSAAESRKPRRRDSAETVESVTSIYIKGDLGFIPKPVIPRSRLPTKKHVECQTSISLEQISESAEGESESDLQGSGIGIDKLEEIDEEATVPEEEKHSIIFFGDEESVVEESTVSYGSADLREFMDTEKSVNRFLSDIFVPDNTVGSTINTLRSSRSRVAYEKDLAIQQRQSSFVSGKKSEIESAEKVHFVEAGKPDDTEKEIEASSETEIDVHIGTETEEDTNKDISDTNETAMEEKASDL